MQYTFICENLSGVKIKCSRAASHIKIWEIKGERQVQNIEQKTKEIDFEIWGNCGFFLMTNA